MMSEDGREGRSPAIVYLEGQSALFRSGGFWNCLAAARKLSALLLAEGRSPWIARLRKTEVTERGVFHAPLVARARFRGGLDDALRLLLRRGGLRPGGGQADAARI